ncbi:MAG TPA: glycogen debranching protein GlgX [Casimicrobiaceae bacterium]|nr:glycogen debranching protein GlgX [Casimicrobiaceae bacterium]
MVKPIREIWPGRQTPRGAHWDGEGVNFALFSEAATRVELCIFDASGRRELQRVPLAARTDQVWHCYLPEARPGLLYGYRVHGPYRPDEGHRFNPHKLVLDPYARQVVGGVKWTDALFGYTVGHRRADLSFDRRDSASAMPKCRIVDPAFTWGDDRPPDVPMSDSVIYELNVRGFTMQHPDVPPAVRGSFAALATAPVIDYLKRLGVTAVELLPVHAFVDDRHLVAKNLANFWGYNTIGFFAPESRYLSSGSISEFKTMVRTLHSAGIEIILDVVYNHTAEGNELGPTLCFRGVDNAAYYRLQPDNARYYRDYTGCGNTLDARYPAVLQLMMDSLRYWVTEMHVDGFRFDLASALAREMHEVDPFGSFFDIIHQDPVLRRVKLIAEPWDLGEGGYQVGHFPPGWAEWNDRYRDTIRAYWRGDGGQIGEFARRLTASTDLYAHSGRLPQASVNFITAHDGFTLRDLVSYDHKHNEANLEENRDGSDNNLSWNCGVEGATDDASILALRERQSRNFIATLLLSQGVPMIVAGDEIGRTQRGNNNAYCQDTPLSWVDWTLDPSRERMLGFVRRLIAFRREHSVFHRREFLQGRPVDGSAGKDIAWLKPDGNEMSPQEWEHDFARCLGVYLGGDALNELDARGRVMRDDNFLLLFNAHHDSIPFKLPQIGEGEWILILDTVQEQDAAAGAIYPPFDIYDLAGRSFALLRNVVTR